MAPNRGQYQQVDDGDALPLRPSLEAAYRTSSDLDSLDEFELVDKSKQPRRGFAEEKYSPTAASSLFNTSQRQRSRLLRWCFPSRLCCLILGLVVLAITLAISGGGFLAYKTAPKDGQSPPWYPTPLGGTVKSWETSYRRASEMVRKMSLVEKVNVTTGVGWSQEMCVGNTGRAESVGFPSLCLQDGPLGLRFVDNITAFPAGVTVGATWNKDLMYRRGRALGQEARAKGVNVWLGPAMGPLGRSPLGGRNWEGFGSDPVLQGIAAVQTIKGVQEEGVMATAKHFIGNEQEHFRQSWEWGTPNAISSNIDDRTLHEIYAWPFYDSVRAGVASVMCSYNQVNNSYACGNSKLLNGVLKDELGFQGFVQSDWLAQRSGVASALAGLDMTMPGDGLKWMDGKSLWGAELTKAVLNTSVPMVRLNDMVTRIVAAWYQLGQDEWERPPPNGKGGPNFSSWTNDRIGFLHPASDSKDTGIVNQFVNAQGEGDDFHGNLAREIAAEGVVLLKNENNALPLSTRGPTESKEHLYQVGIFGEDAQTNPDGPNACPDRGCNVGTLAQGWGSGAVDYPYLISPLDALIEAFDKDYVQLNPYPTNALPKKEASKIIADQDLCLVFANADAGEGFIAADGIRGDRNELNLQKGGGKLITQVANQCSNTIVVIHAVGPVLMESFIEHPNVTAVLHANLPGEESGHALVDILFGDVNPSGHLPYTIGKNLSDYGPGAQILYYPNAIVPQANFDEGIFVDYRYFDTKSITPRYEFGYGLSYTTFSMSGLFIQTLPARKTLIPSPRPTNPESTPPSYPNDIPDAQDTIFPSDFRKIKNYIYPYLTRKEASSIRKDTYAVPGYATEQQASPAGGGEGGNPSLWEPIARVTVSVFNTGAVPGDAVVQLYISFPAGATGPDGEVLPGAWTEDGKGLPFFPVRVLRGFEKVRLEPAKQPAGHQKSVTGKRQQGHGGEGMGMGMPKGKGKKVVFEITRRDVSYWDVARQNWVVPKGEIKVELGWSSRDLVVDGVI